MTLTTNGLNWLAQNAGAGNCFVANGVSYKDADGISQVGGTKDVVTAFLTASLVGKTTAVIIANTHYNAFKSINGNQGLEFSDVGEAADREATGGTYPQYCYSGNGGTPQPPPEPSMDARVGTYDFTGAFCTGDPTGGISVPDDVSMHHTHSLVLNKKWFEINGVEISNTSACLAYFAVEMRMWSGTHSYCPTTTPAWKGVNRNVEEEFIRNIPIDIMKTEDMFLDFLIPEIGMGAGQLPAGTYTICLYVWANFSKYDLGNELELAGYTNPEN